MELSDRLYDSGPESKSKIRIGYLGSKFGSKSGSWIQVEADLRQKGTGVRECVESVFGASKNRKSKNAQNEILNVRKFGRKVLKTTLGHSLIIGFALKNYAQKWSQIVKTLDG